MKELVRRVAGVVLWALTGLFTFTMACAYGMFTRFDRFGRVVDAGSHTGLPAIQVSCRVGTTTEFQTTSATDGTFTLYFAAMMAANMAEAITVYEARDPESIREHARRVGMPADQIFPVLDTIIVREDPVKASAAA